MKKVVAIFICALLLLSILPVSATEASDDSTVIVSSSTLDSQMPLLGNQQLVSNTQAAILYETTTDTLMYAHNPDAQISPASLVKILTALIAVEKGSLSDVVTVRADVLATLDPDAAVVELMVDEVLTVEDLLYCMMVGSGNDAAVVLADHVLGNQAAFVAEMNRYAQELGCTGTNFTNVHGLSDKDQYTTARDVARILAKAIQNETFCKVYGARYYSVPATNKSDARHLSTQNYLMNNDDVIIYFDTRVTGSRTGLNSDRSRSIASAAKEGDMSLICVVIGAKSQYEKDGYTEKVFGGYDETKQLLDLGFQGYKPAQILHTNQILLQRPVTNGNSQLSIGTHSSAFSVIPEGTDANGLTYRYLDEINLTAPIKKGQKVSTLQVWCGNACIAQTDLFAMNSVEVIGADDSNNGSGAEKIGFGTVLLYVIGAVVVVAFILFLYLCILRAIRISKVKEQSRRRRRNRRRTR